MLSRLLVLGALVFSFAGLLFADDANSTQTLPEVQPQPTMLPNCERTFHLLVSLGYTQEAADFATQLAGYDVAQVRATEALLEKLPPVGYWQPTFTNIFGAPRKDKTPLSKEDTLAVLQLITNNDVADLLTKSITEPLSLNERRAAMVLMGYKRAIVNQLGDTGAVFTWLARVSAWLWGQPELSIEKLVSDAESFWTSSPNGRLASLRKIAEFMQGFGDLESLEATLAAEEIRLKEQINTTKGLSKDYTKFAYQQVIALQAMLKSEKQQMLVAAKQVLNQTPLRLDSWVLKMFGPKLYQSLSARAWAALKNATFVLAFAATGGGAFYGYLMTFERQNLTPHAPIESLQKEAQGTSNSVDIDAKIKALNGQYLAGKITLDEYTRQVDILNASRR